MFMRSIAVAFISSGGRPTGFDYLRIILAVAVVAWHTIVTSYGPDVQDAAQLSRWRSLIAVILPMFFALSGFLVAGSLDRSQTVIKFLGLRAIRIYPALMAEVLLSALIIGPIFTASTWGEYFSSPVFYNYFWNLIGHVQFKLPGLFLDNPNPNQVNGQLWTIPWELYCYIALAGMAVIGLARRRGLQFLAALALSFALFTAFLYQKGFDFSTRATSMPGFMLVLCFLAGVSFYQWRERVPYSIALFLASAASSLLLLQVPVYGDFVAIVPITYCTIVLGVTNFKRTWLLGGADYSYGIFLYGYVIQQAWMTLGPSVHNWAINFALAVPTAVVFAMASWHWVEKPSMNALRDKIGAFEDLFLKQRERIWTSKASGSEKG